MCMKSLEEKNFVAASVGEQERLSQDFDQAMRLFSDWWQSRPPNVEAHGIDNTDKEEIEEYVADALLATNYRRAMPPSHVEMSRLAHNALLVANFIECKATSMEHQSAWKGGNYPTLVKAYKALLDASSNDSDDE